MKRTFLFAALLFLSSCQPACEKMDPIIICPLSSHRFEKLPSPFPPISKQEHTKDWATEIALGNGFAKECDFYRAITCYKRALFLLPGEEKERHLQLDYDLMLCYYLGGKHQEALNVFEQSDLSQADPNFPAFNHLLLIVYDCYLETKQEEKAACVLSVIQKFSPETQEALTLYQTFKEGDIEKTRTLLPPSDFTEYDHCAKSPAKARLFNALLPGAGYYYVGLHKSAVTSFLINALFTAAAYQFFRNGYPAAGIITASLESGWYLGGINGAGIEAQEFNTRLYEGLGRKILTEHVCFPLLMFEAGF